METVLIAAAIAGAGALWWHHTRAPLRALPAPQPDADIVLHVARHEADQRGHAIAAVHLLYGLLQDEDIAAAIHGEGGSVDRLEDRVLEALANHRSSHELADEFVQLMMRAAHVAGSARRPLCARDLWAALGGSSAEPVLERAAIHHVSVLFRLCHGCGEPRYDASDVDHQGAVTAGDVHIVFRNDDYTTCDFVTESLCRHFAASPPRANELMLQTHREGRAIVARMANADAIARVRLVREHARQRGFPLWVGIEPT